MSQKRKLLFLIVLTGINIGICIAFGISHGGGLFGGNHQINLTFVVFLLTALGLTAGTINLILRFNKEQN